MIDPCTATWHMDDLNISHMDLFEVTKLYAGYLEFMVRSLPYIGMGYMIT